MGLAVEIILKSEHARNFFPKIENTSIHMSENSSDSQLKKGVVLAKHEKGLFNRWQKTILKRLKDGK